ncbi:MAG: tRNA glutamyl-Q synthetase [Bacteroidetes bacterium CG12_big_fil_rev_8_21_14_0_65_60_17]|nr:MAG: tRNA glutamyl-Q synthetase [Bacteroidetes bacterium CG12_big_fil_rev_8_21_14_0_65_60_17]
MKMGKKIITRFAPTPSGFLHMGNVWNLLLVEHIAREQEARLWLRIDDLDRARYRRAYTEDIFCVAAWLDIGFDGGPENATDFEANWSQRHRMQSYQEALHALVANGNVFACTCSRRDVAAASSQGIYPGTCLHAGIPLDAPDVAWRFRTPGMCAGSSREAIHPIVRRRDGAPAYHIATIVDDVNMGMTHIVRGRDLATSTQLQRVLADAMGGEFKKFSRIRFYHHDLLTTPGGAKLSKSAGSGARSLLSEDAPPAEDIRRRFATWQKAHVLSPDADSGPDQ